MSLTSQLNAESYRKYLLTESNSILKVIHNDRLELSLDYWGGSPQEHLAA